MAKNCFALRVVSTCGGNEAVRGETMARKVVLLLEITDVSMTRGLRDTGEHLEPTTESRMSGSKTRDARSMTL
jgi:hypothetical protein